MLKVIKNSVVVGRESIENKDIVLNEAGCIESFNEVKTEYGTEIEVIDAKGNYAFPGMIDLLTHGFGKHLYLDCEEDAFINNSKALLKHGVTGYYPSITSMPLNKHLETLTQLSQLKTGVGARMLGLHSEGPCFGAAGAHDPENLVLPSAALAKDLIKAGEGLLKIVTLSPELEGAAEFCKLLKDNGVAVHFGHSKAPIDLIPKISAMGIDAVTHMFDVIFPVAADIPGVYPVSMADALIAEKDLCLGIICDGVHTTPTQIKLLTQLPLDRVFLETDSMKFTGLPPGKFELYPGYEVTTTEGKGAWSGTALSGSTLTSDIALRNFINYSGADLVRASHASSLNPARLVGLDDELGSLEIGKKADIILLDKDDLSVMATIIGGQKLYAHENF